MKIHPRGSLIYNRYQVEKAPDFKRGTLMGGMGFVYFCHDTEADRPVALKFFKPEYLSDRLARDRFLHEGNAWIELGSHPHIVRCYDVKYMDPTAFLVLELITKKRGMKDASLRSWMGAPMPLDQSLLFALQIARGMQYATEKIPGFVHRDLKPENVLVGADKLPGTNINRVCVTDFGLIKIAIDAVVDVPVGNASNSNDVQANSIPGRGTPKYMAPEQRKKDKPVGVYTDVYALGCILSEMVSGRLVVDGETEEQLQVAHGNGELRPIRQDLPESVSVFLERSRAEDPENRYQTWDEVTATLEELYAGLGVGPVPHENGQEGETEAERRSTASSYNVMGIDYAHMGNMQVALRYFKKALTIFQEIHDLEGEGAVQGNMGNAYAQLGKMDEALYYCEQDLTIARERQDRTREGVALGNLGDVYRNLGDVHRAIDCYEQRLRIVRETDDRRGEGNTMTSLGLACIAQGKLHDALDNFNKALAIFQGIGDRRGEGSAVGNLGNAYAQLGQMDNALNHYNLYLKIAFEIGDRVGESNAWGNLGNVSLAQGKVRDAIDFYQRGLEIAREIGDKRAEGNALGNLGIAFSQQGSTDDALKYYQERLEIAGEIGDKEGLCATLFNMGSLHMKNGQVENAAIVWVDLYVFARKENLPQALRRLENLAPKFGWANGLEDWKSLAQSMQKL